ncbi:hypothetical protein Fot_04252 [Forsythia ovata]|uniref:Uncharacterized protein n=1 Tax=Forsythia ovata TaxID=205694 RepID=A0ABD1XC23_9LAMI
MDINTNDQNVKSPAGNSKNTASGYSSGPENSHLTSESRDIVEVLDDPQLRVRCTLHASLEEREEEYVRLFVPGPRKEDPILDAYLHEDGDDGANGDEELADIFKNVQEYDLIRSPIAQDKHDAGQSSPTAASVPTQ